MLRQSLGLAGLQEGAVIARGARLSAGKWHISFGMHQVQAAPRVYLHLQYPTTACSGVHTLAHVRVWHMHRNWIKAFPFACADSGMDASGWVALPELIARLDCNATEAEVLAVIDTSEKVCNALGMCIQNVTWPFWCGDGQCMALHNT